MSWPRSPRPLMDQTLVCSVLFPMFWQGYVPPLDLAARPSAASLVDVVRRTKRVEDTGC